MKHPKISICIPAYNQPDSIERLLTSVRNQTFLDYEVVITDDSTTNAVFDVVAQFKDIQNLRYQKNEAPKGPAANWNASIDLATGDYVKIMHHDDWFASENSLGEFAKMLDDHPDVDFGFSAANAFDERQVFRFKHLPSAIQLRRLKSNLRCIFDGNFIGAPSATIFRRMIGVRFDQRLQWLVDIDFYMQVLMKNSNFTFSSAPLVCITTGSSQQVTAKCQGDRCIELREYFFVYQKIKNRPTDIVRYFRPFWSLIKRAQVVSISDIYVCGNKIIVPSWVRGMVFLRIIFAISRLEKIARKIRQMFWKIRSTVDRKRHWKISYSQCGEDLIVDFIFAWLGIMRPSYLDIGAHHPTYLSNTYKLYKRGSFGVSVEPDPMLYSRIKRVRGKEVSLNVGVGINETKNAKFYIMTTRTLNTFSKEEAERYQSYGIQKIESVVDIPLLSVNEIIEEHCKTTPNFVSLDVEGFDFQILQAFDFDRYRPEVFCIETLTFTENNTEQKLTEIIDLMKTKNYFVYADTYINTIFVDRLVWDARKHD